MFLTLRSPKLRTPPRQMGRTHTVEPSTRTFRCECAHGHSQDPAMLASSIRELSMKAHNALKTGADESTLARLVSRIDGTERGFRELGLHDLARFAGNLKRKLKPRG